MSMDQGIVQTADRVRETLLAGRKIGVERGAGEEPVSPGRPHSGMLIESDMVVRGCVGPALLRPHFF